jgi:excisionase family DNA binding protein
MNTTAEERPALLNQRQVAEILGVSKHTMRLVIAAGTLEPVRIAGLGRPRYRRADVERLVEGRAPGKAG